MPVVPNADMWVQSVMPQGQLAYQDIHAAPEEFGSRWGQALETLGRQGMAAGSIPEREALALQQIINETNVNDTYANKFDPAMRQKYMDFLKLRGKDAWAAFPDFQEQIKDLANQTRADLPNAPQQKNFDEISRRRISADLDVMARHAAAQAVAWQNETTGAVSDLYSKRIVDHRYDFDKVAGPNGLIQNIRILNQAQNELMGQEKAQTGLNAAAAIDKGLSDAVLTEAQLNPTGAKMLYDRYEPYMSSDEVRQHVLDNLLPAVRQEQTAAVYNDVLKRFNLTGPDSDIHAATSWLMDPNNYQDQLAGPDQRTGMAQMIQGAWNRVRQFHEENQSSADSNFTDAVAKRDIAGLGLQTWKDPKTGLSPSGDILQAAVEQGAAPVLNAPRGDNDTLVSLSNDIANRRLSDPGPINLAYLRNLITDRDFRDLTGLYDTYRDPAKSRWFDSARTAFCTRYADPNGPDGINADAIKLFPQYITELDQTVRDQDLKCTQIRNSADKILQDIDRTLVRRWFGSIPPALDFADQAKDPEFRTNWKGGE